MTNFHFQFFGLFQELSEDFVNKMQVHPQDPSLISFQSSGSFKSDIKNKYKEKFQVCSESLCQCSSAINQQATV